MKVKFILLVCSLIALAFDSKADVTVDRSMSKIGRDTKSYISADCRASSEQEAYDLALEELSRKITSYIHESQKTSPDAVYLPEVSSIYQRLDSKISDDRYRVFLYVKKSDLKPLSDTANAMIMEKKSDETYEVLPIPSPDPIVIRDTVTIVEEKTIPMNPIISQLVGISDRTSFVSSLTDLRKDNKISAAAAFPIANINDFYVALIINEIVTNIYHVVEGKWIDVRNGNEVNPSNFSAFSAYWFTLPK